MYDRKSNGSDKPDQRSPDSSGPITEPSGQGVGGKPPHLTALGAGAKPSAREGDTAPLANSVSIQPQFFNFDAQAIRVVGDHIDPWFIAKDVCAVLGLAHVGSSIRDLDADEKGVHTVHTLGGDQQLASVNESGLYTLTFRSRKSKARAFRKWVTSEVLPSIRKKGHYGLGAPDLATYEELVRMVFDLHKFHTELRANIEAAGRERDRIQQAPSRVPAVHPRRAALEHANTLYSDGEILAYFPASDEDPMDHAHITAAVREGCGMCQSAFCVKKSKLADRGLIARTTFSLWQRTAEGDTMAKQYINHQLN